MGLIHSFAVWAPQYNSAILIDALDVLLWAGMLDVNPWGFFLLLYLVVANMFKEK